jgi:outer membrane protein assembly factor BamB
MFGNGKIFISHTSTDSTRCDVLLSALDAWQVDYWFDLLDLSAGQEFFDYIQHSLADRDIFIRVCTPAAKSSTWMTQEAALARSQKSPNRTGQRLIINLVLDSEYELTPDERRDVVIDAAQAPMDEWIRKLRMSLSIPARGQPISRRSIVGLGIASIAALGAVGYAGDLLLAQGTVPSLRPITSLTRLTPQPSQSRLVWSYSIGSDAVVSFAPSAICLSSDGIALYVSTFSGILSLGLSDGKLQWQQSGPAGNTDLFYQGAPAVVPSTLFVLGQIGGDNQTLYLTALNSQDGSERRHSTLEQSNGGVGLYTLSIVAAGNQLIMQYDGILEARDANGTTPTWRRVLDATVDPTAINLPYSVISAPVVADGIIYTGLADGNLYANDLATGTLRWQMSSFATAAAIQSTPSIAGNLLHVGRNDGYLYAVDINTQKLVWRKLLVSPSFSGSSSDMVLAAPLVLAGAVYIAGGTLDSFGDSLTALDAKTGRIFWQVHPSHSVRGGRLIAYPIAAQPAILGDRLYIAAKLALTQATCIDVLYALDIKDGSELWHFEVPGIGTFEDSPALLPSSPVIVNQTLYFASSAGTVYALSIA